MVQLIQNFVWILISGESMDPLKWAFLKVEILNGFKWSISRRDNMHTIDWFPWVYSSLNVLNTTVYTGIIAPIHR